MADDQNDYPPLAPQQMASMPLTAPTYQSAGVVNPLAQDTMPMPAQMQPQQSMVPSTGNPTVDYWQQQQAAALNRLWQNQGSFDRTVKDSQGKTANDRAQALAEQMMNHSAQRMMAKDSGGIGQALGNVGALLAGPLFGQRGSQVVTEIMRNAHARNEARDANAIAEAKQAMDILRQTRPDSKVTKQLSDIMTSGAKYGVAAGQLGVNKQNADTNVAKQKALEKYQQGTLDYKNDFNGIRQQDVTNRLGHWKAQDATKAKDVDSIIDYREGLKDYHDKIANATALKSAAYNNYVNAQTPELKARAATEYQNADTRAKQMVLNHNLGVQRLNLMGRAMSTAINAKGHPVHQMPNEKGEMGPVEWTDEKEYPMPDQEEVSGEFVGSPGENQKFQSVMQAAQQSQQPQGQAAGQMQSIGKPKLSKEQLIQKLKERGLYHG